ncbi:hypothetical protein F2P81_021669 [Scophthalmus maximus]|uniref:Uncharacterized protein n=1 Tax=Scophthalmus maximus TaxID=52904 RepID=A0A6A4S6T9_SCOMX|nr:hypothetical protein F2P81_021669 [Scophthalmus maximus]
MTLSRSSLIIQFLSDHLRRLSHVTVPPQRFPHRGSYIRRCYCSTAADRVQLVVVVIGDYIGQKLRENAFDPKGKGTSTVLDDLAHYDLAINVALWWLDKDGGRDVLDSNIIGATSSSGGRARYPNRREREAMILSSFAGIIMSSLPVDDILTLYRCKPAASYPNQRSKDSSDGPEDRAGHYEGSQESLHD